MSKKSSQPTGSCRISGDAEPSLEFLLALRDSYTRLQVNGSAQSEESTS